MVLSKDTALYHVTEAYDMDGLTPRFDLSNHAVQKFYSTVTDGAPWMLMHWYNDGYDHCKDRILAGSLWKILQTSLSASGPQ